jgi:hypothetical protein
MSKMTMSVLASVALIGSASFAFADNSMSGQPMAQPVSNVQTSGQVVCHHDGEIIQSATGPVLCHMRPVSGIHFKSREWFGAVGARAAGNNN